MAVASWTTDLTVALCFLTFTCVQSKLAIYRVISVSAAFSALFLVPETRT